MLDAAQQRWPEIRDRKALLLQLAASGAAELEAQRAQSALAERQERQREAFDEIRGLIDVERLMSDDAWS